MGTLPASGAQSKAPPNSCQHPQCDFEIRTNHPISHNTTLDLVLAALAHVGLTVSPKKCILASSEISFWGFRATVQGLTHDPHKAEEVQHAEHPQTRDEVKPFLCMIRSNGQFIPNLVAATAILRELIKDNAVFQWSDAHEAEFQNPKSSLQKTFC